MADGMGPLFDWTPPAPSALKGLAAEPDQKAQLARVLRGNEAHIMAFLRKAIGHKAGQFHASELLGFVNEQRVAAGKKPCAGDSPRRVMRELEEQGCCQVLLISKTGSLYQVVSVSEE